MLTRKCPQCNDILTYSSIGNKNFAERQKRLCRSCTFFGRHPSDSTRHKMSESQSKRRHPESVKQKMRGSRNGMYGVHRYDNLNPFYGKKHDFETCRKMRVAACLRVLRLQRSGSGRISNLGKNEQQYFDQLEKERGWFGNRQHFIEHLGYFVDYYEPTLNIVVEYDEPRHYIYGALREKDVERMRQIKDYLGCEFWRYDAYRGQLVKF